MVTKYFLTRFISKDQLEIDEERFKSLIKSKSQLMEALYLEEKYDTFLSNYLVIEKETLTKTIEKFFLRNDIYKNSQELRHTMNRLFINLLSSIKMYQDQAPSHIRNCLFENEGTLEKVRLLFSKEFDSFIEYQFMDAMRNHAQHGGQAVHSVSFKADNLGVGDSMKNEYSISIWALKSIISQNPKFKAGLLKKIDDRIDLIRFSRRYIECLNNCHIQMRDLISETVEIARRDIQSIINDYTDSFLQDSINLYLVMKDENNQEIGEKISLFLEYDDERIALERKNQKLLNVQMACFSSTSYPSLK
jgi:hypothetical protein